MKEILFILDKMVNVVNMNKNKICYKCKENIIINLHNNNNKMMMIKIYMKIV